MARPSRNQTPVDSQAPVPTFAVNMARVDAAYDAHAALLKAERDAPNLRNLPSFTMAKMDAYEAFARAFERV